MFRSLSVAAIAAAATLGASQVQAAVIVYDFEEVAVGETLVLDYYRNDTYYQPRLLLKLSGVVATDPLGDGKVLETKYFGFNAAKLANPRNNRITPLLLSFDVLMPSGGFADSDGLGPSVNVAPGTWTTITPQVAVAGGGARFNLRTTGAAYIDNFIWDDNVMSIVPEPSSWALMIAGFGCVGAALRRRAAIA